MTCTRYVGPIFLAIPLVFQFVFVVMASTGNYHFRYGMQVKVNSGANAGRQGTVVSSPWLGNGFHRWVSINVRARRDEVLLHVTPEMRDYYLSEFDKGRPVRHWISEPAGNIEKTEENRDMGVLAEME